MFWDRCLLYKGTSIEKYNEIKNILQINSIKYSVKIRNKNSYIGPMVDKIIIGTLGQKEDFSNEYSIFVKKKSYEYANYIINKD
ncbi:conserved hypothetical protein [Clostridium neonatale]|uniref:hypothetical protein n=1 Tax=Clostridium neonatale TaxID=137838 RepID=UPI00291BDBF5|nr:hypothetical protein [Clostridium neonatale]CAI3677107.1 conserved hypothetical protein [Clostridium neonatale]